MVAEAGLPTRVAVAVVAAAKNGQVSWNPGVLLQQVNEAISQGACRFGVVGCGGLWCVMLCVTQPFSCTLYTSNPGPASVIVMSAGSMITNTIITMSPTCSHTLISQGKCSEWQTSY